MKDTLHWVRDVVFDDYSQVRTGNGPRILASFNLTIAVLRLTGVTNTAAALCHHTRRPHQPLNTITAY